MSPAIVRAISDVTHGRGKLVLGHPTDLQGIETALAGGVDVLMHTTPASGPWSETLARAHPATTRRAHSNAGSHQAR